MPGLIGKKIGMTSVFGADGKNIPCTVIEAGPCVVTQLRTVEKDGYAAVQLEGYTEAAKNGTINVGYNKLTAAAEGVKTGSSGIERLVIYSDESTVGIIL